jgi:hypothetical protein
VNKSIKVRFNLGRGDNYLKWQVIHPDGDIIYYNPYDVQLVMTQCTFKNNKKTAQKIFNGQNKSVCAWILCKEIKVYTGNIIKDEANKVSYNPRVRPNWLHDGEVVDDVSLYQLHTINSRIYISPMVGVFKNQPQK